MLAGSRILISLRLTYHRIIDPIASRCARYPFKPLSAESTAKHIRKIADAESLSYDDDVLQHPLLLLLVVVVACCCCCCLLLLLLVVVVVVACCCCCCLLLVVVACCITYIWTR